MTTSIARTLTSNGSRRKGTLSFWYKKCEVGTSRMVFSCYTSGGNNHNILFNTDDTLRFTSQVSSSKKIDLVTTRKFRDPNAWYHIVTAFDTEQGTDTNRAKMYINGVQETSFTNASGGSPTYPSQDQDLQVNISGEHIYFNKNGDGAGMEASCVYSHIHYIDGTMYDASAFGSTDSTTGEWKINTSPSVTYGTNGFFILKDGNSVTDQSGNSNDFSVEQGTLTKTEDCPSNVFCTMNALDKSYSGTAALSNGNTTVTGDGTWQNMRLGTIGVNTGKWYWEMKINSGNNANIHFGIVPETWNMNYSSAYYGQTGYYAFYIGGEKYANGSSSSGSGTFTNGDIVGIALDLDSATKTLSVYQNTQVSGSVVNLDATFDGQFWRPMFMGNNSSATAIGDFNFGNGYFGTTAVSSAGTNASGNGIFEYDVPNGYTALCTKGLNI
jgi:hypothetical protein